MHSLGFVRKELQQSVHLELKDGFAAECVDQNCCFVKIQIKAQFCGRSPYLGGEPHISCVVVDFLCVVSVMFFYALISR